MKATLEDLGLPGDDTVVKNGFPSLDPSNFVIKLSEKVDAMKHQRDRILESERSIRSKGDGGNSFLSPMEAALAEDRDVGSSGSKKESRLKTLFKKVARAIIRGDIQDDLYFEQEDLDQRFEMLVKREHEMLEKVKLEEEAIEKQRQEVGSSISHLQDMEANLEELETTILPLQKTQDAFLSKHGLLPGDLPDPGFVPRPPQHLLERDVVRAFEENGGREAGFVKFDSLMKAIEDTGFIGGENWFNNLKAQLPCDSRSGQYLPIERAEFSSMVDGLTNLETELAAATRRQATLEDKKLERARVRAGIISAERRVEAHRDNLEQAKDDYGRTTAHIEGIIASLADERAQVDSERVSRMIRTVNDRQEGWLRARRAQAYLKKVGRKTKKMDIKALVRQARQQLVTE